MKKSALYLAFAGLTLGATALPTAAFANDKDKDKDTHAQHATAPATWQGTVEAVSPDSLTLKETDGSSVKVDIVKQTKYDNDGKSGAVSDLRTGMVVAVKGEKQKDGSIRAKEIRYDKTRQ